MRTGGLRRSPSVRPNTSASLMSGVPNRSNSSVMKFKSTETMPGTDEVKVMLKEEYSLSRTPQCDAEHSFHNKYKLHPTGLYLKVRMNFSVF